MAAKRARVRPAGSTEAEQYEGQYREALSRLRAALALLALMAAHLPEAVVGQARALLAWMNTCLTVLQVGHGSWRHGCCRGTQPAAEGSLLPPGSLKPRLLPSGAEMKSSRWAKAPRAGGPGGPASGGLRACSCHTMSLVVRMLTRLFSLRSLPWLG